MKNLFASVVWAVTLLIMSLGMSAQAQQQSDAEGVWIQVAARSSLLEAQDEAQRFAAQLPDVAGYALGGGWYGIVLGPYSRGDAEQVLRVYRTEGQIPSDSFITFASNLTTRFYPIGADATAPINAPVVTAQTDVTAPATAGTPAPDVTPDPISTLPDETPAQARRSEQALTLEERKDLQLALQIAGYYDAAIDGAFGRGTRRSMSDWQAARGYEPTGVLTTAQRSALMDEYNAPLISTGMARYSNSDAGIEIDLPLGEVAFARYAPPFVHFDAHGDLGARALLISQPGDRRTLYGLYDIMQTLDIVPLTGPRERSGDSFTLEGRNSEIISYTEAHLANGEIKGFTLIWPTGDEARRARVLAAMKQSFRRLDGVLDPASGMDQAQSVDLVSGLQVRKPRLSRSGFFVSPDGVVVTSSDAVASCSRVTLDRDTPAEILLADDDAGVAVLRPTVQLAPMATADLSDTAPLLRSSVAVSGFSYGGVLGAPSLTWGSLDDLKGLKGEAYLNRLALTAQEGDVGGPVLDGHGVVHGMLLPVDEGATVLPDGVRFAIKSDVLRLALNKLGVTQPASNPEHTGDLPLAALQKKATAMTTLVNCWD